MDQSGQTEAAEEPQNKQQMETEESTEQSHEAVREESTKPGQDTVREESTEQGQDMKRGESTEQSQDKVREESTVQGQDMKRRESTEQSQEAVREESTVQGQDMEKGESKQQSKDTHTEESTEHSQDMERGNAKKEFPKNEITVLLPKFGQDSRIQQDVANPEVMKIEEQKAPIPKETFNGDSSMDELYNANELVVEPYTQEEIEGFMYSPDSSTDPEIQDAACSLRKNPEFQKNAKFHVVVLSSKEGDKDTPTRLEMTVRIDYLKRIFQVGRKVIKLGKILFVTLNKIENTSPSYELVVSFHDDNTCIQFVHITCRPGNVRQLVECLNGFRRMIYDVCKNLHTTVEVYKEILEKYLPIFTGSIAKATVINLQQPDEFPEFEGSLYLCIDSEGLMIMISQFAERPLHRLFFWNEYHPKCVERIVVFREQNILYIHTPTIRIEINNYQEGEAGRFLDCLKCLCQQPSPIFPDYGENMIEFGFSCFLMEIGTLAWTQQKHISLDMSDERATGNTRLKSFKEAMMTAVRTYENRDELAKQWVIADNKLQTMIESGFVPDTDLFNLGLDPDNLDHFFKCVDNIQEQLGQQNYDTALSRLKVTKKIFRESVFWEMITLLHEDDRSLLRSLYFHTCLADTTKKLTENV